MFPFSVQGDGVSSHELAQEMVVEAELAASSPGSAATRWVWKNFTGALWRN